MWGSIIAAAVLTILPEALRGLANYRMLIYAIVLIVVMIATNSKLLQNIPFLHRKDDEKSNQAEGGGANE